MNDTGEKIILFILGLWVGFMISMVIFTHTGINLGREEIRDAAIAAQVAEWQIDPVTGEKSFVYLTQEKLSDE